jgi:hypothetical protein
VVSWGSRANTPVYNLDGIVIPIPRHREIGEGLTEQIYREYQPKLGRVGGGDELLHGMRA